MLHVACCSLVPNCNEGIASITASTRSPSKLIYLSACISTCARNCELSASSLHPACSFPCCPFICDASKVAPRMLSIGLNVRLFSFAMRPFALPKAVFCCARYDARCAVCRTVHAESRLEAHRTPHTRPQDRTEDQTAHRIPHTRCDVPVRGRRRQTCSYLVPPPPAPHTAASACSTQHATRSTHRATQCATPGLRHTACNAQNTPHRG